MRRASVESSLYDAYCIVESNLVAVDEKHSHEAVVRRVELVDAAIVRVADRSQMVLQQSQVVSESVVIGLSQVRLEGRDRTIDIIP